MFAANSLVLITACADDPRAAGLIGEVIDEVPPGPLTQGRWTIHTGAFLIGPVLCHSHELQPASH